MKKFLGLLLLFCFTTTFVSCKKDKFTTDGLLLASMKDASEHYREECNYLTAASEMRYSDFSIHSTRFDTLKLITTRLDSLFIRLKTKNKEQILQMQQASIDSINNFKSTYKISVISPEKLKILDQETLYYYLKAEYYKNQMSNCSEHFNRMPVFCGMKVLSKKQQDMIDAITDSNIR